MNFNGFGGLKRRSRCSVLEAFLQPIVTAIGRDWAPGERAWPIAGFFRYRELFFRILKWNVLFGDLLVAVVAMSIDRSVDLWQKRVSTRIFSIQ